jgi:hypothetical protein
LTFENHLKMEKEVEKAKSLLRVMLLQKSPPKWMILAPGSPLLQVVQEGVRLRAGLPAYLAQRRALLDVHCLLIAPLRALVRDYQVPTTTEELWATGLGMDPQER